MQLLAGLQLPENVAGTHFHLALQVDFKKYGLTSNIPDTVTKGDVADVGRPLRAFPRLGRHSDTKLELNRFRLASGVPLHHESRWRFLNNALP